MLQLEDGLGVEQVVLTLPAPLVLAADIGLERPGAGLRPLVRVAMAPGHLLGQLGQTNAAQPARRRPEVPVHKSPFEPDRLEDLGPGVRRDRRDAHLRHHLQHALARGLQVLAEGLPFRNLAQQAVAHHLGDRLEREVGVHRGRAVPDQKGEVVHLPGITALDYEPHPGALLLPHEMVVNRSGEKKRRDRRAGGARVAVRQHDDVGAEGDGLRHLLADLVDGRFEPRSALAHREQAVDGKAVEPGRLTVLVDIEQLRQVVVVYHRVRQADLSARGRLRLQQVPLRSDRGLERGHELFADGVEGRVRHLGEELGEVVVQQPRALGEHGEGRVGAHRSDGLVPGRGHRLDDEA